MVLCGDSHPSVGRGGGSVGGGCKAVGGQLTPGSGMAGPKPQEIPQSHESPTTPPLQPAPPPQTCLPSGLASRVTHPGSQGRQLAEGALESRASDHSSGLPAAT